MNNVDIMQQINKIHNTNPNRCCFQGAPFNPHSKIRERTMQYNAKHGQIPPQYRSEQQVRFSQQKPHTASSTTTPQNNNDTTSDDHMDDVPNISPDNPFDIVPSANSTYHNDYEDHNDNQQHTHDDTPSYAHHDPYCGMTSHLTDHDMTDNAIPLHGEDIEQIRL